MSFKAGTYKGINITYGSDGVQGAFLIRALKDMDTSEYIEGPCNCSTLLLGIYGHKEFKTLDLKSWPHDDGDPFDTKSLFYL